MFFVYLINFFVKENLKIYYINFYINYYEFKKKIIEYMLLVVYLFILVFCYFVLIFFKICVNVNSLLVILVFNFCLRV